MITRDYLLSFFKEKITRPVSFMDIALLLTLSSSEKRKLKRVIREMVDEGDIVRTRKGLYGMAEEMSLVTGYFEAHKDGYGFVILEKPGSRDIFIPARATLGAMDNDRVVAKVENEAKRDGKIVRILERAYTRIVGTFEAGRATFHVRPKSRSVPFNIYISQKDKGNAKDGDNVVAEIISYPAEKRPAAGRIMKVLKKAESPIDEIEGIIDELNLPKKFPARVLEEAKDLYNRINRDRPHFLKDKMGSVPIYSEKRKDLRGLPTVTIDGERAKDFDDAVSIAKTDNGYRLWVHIADVGFYVKWDSYIDKEARKRGTSVYFPDRVIPMLPKELSEDLCSLRPKVDRPAFTVEMEFGRQGERLNAKYYPSLIRSDERMTYTLVKKILVDKDPEERGRYDYLLKDFETMEELCNIIKDTRIKRGSLDFDLPEPEVLLDLQGNPEDIIKAERNFAHMIIEEFMIAANEAVAEHLASLGVPSLYRIHEEPDQIKMEGIMKVVNSLGLNRDTSHSSSKGKNKGKMGSVPVYSDLLREIRGTPAEEIINHMVLRSLKQARYSPVNVGHFGLASECYTHFTSPIRRYPDLVVHRILREVLAVKTLSDARVHELETILPDMAFHSSMMERQSDEAERSVLNAMRVWFMKDKVGEEFEGRVVSVSPYGLKIRLKDYYVEGFLHVSYMTDDYYQYNEKNLSLIGSNRKKQYTIGKEMRIRIDKVDMEEREIVFGQL